MKIVFLAPFGIRPKGTLIARLLPLAKELRLLNHEIAIIAPPYTNPEDSGKTEVVEGINIHNIALGYGNKIKATFQNSKRMYQAALAESPDLVHLFKPKGYAGLAAMYLALKNRLGLKALPLIVDTDDWEGKGGMNELHDYSRAEKFIFNFQEQWLPLRAQGVTVASRALLSQVMEMGVPETKVLYLPNCVEPVGKGDGGKVRKHFAIPEAAPVVLLYTRFFEFDQQRLYRVFRELIAHRPELRLLVVGKGRRGEDEALVRFARGAGLSGNMVFAGWTEPEDVPDLLAAADAAIYPLDDTLVNRAKCPAKLTEIMLAETPVVADRVGQAAEYIRHGENGLLADPSSPGEMIEGILRILADRTFAQTLGRRAREFMLKNYRWRDAADRLNEFYVERLKRP
jgi:glycosyltransferase involved in cell wall biosynthesis